MLSLNRKYIQVERNGRLSYGGSQMWSDNPTVKICGSDRWLFWIRFCISHTGRKAR